MSINQVTHSITITIKSVDSKYKATLEAGVGHIDWSSHCF